MSGFAAFLANMVGSLVPTAIPLFSHGFKGVKGAFQSMSDATTGAHLTGAQQEANQFAAQQAQEQRAFEERMSNTGYQRGTTDMVAAGLNPALMYGNGSAASTPSGSAATSVSPGQPDVVGLLGQMANLALLGSQKRNLDANTGKTIAETDLTKQNIVKAGAEIQSIKANVRKVGLEADAQDIINKYLDRKENVALQNMTLEGNNLAAQWTETQQKIANLKADEQKILQDIAESTERVNYLLSQESLNSAQIDEIKHTIAKIDVERDNLIKTGKVLDKDIDFYEWNHGNEMVVAGVRSGTRYIPSKKFRDKNR